MNNWRLAPFLALLPLAAAAAPTIQGCPVLPANNVWNARVDTLPVHPRSADYVNSIGAATRFHMDFGAGLYPAPPDPDGAPIGIPYNVVPGTQQKVPVAFDYADESDPGPYPIPPNALIEGVGPANADGDRHVLVIDRDNCILYETFYSFPVNNGASWTAGSGAIWPLNSNNLRTAGWTSADAAGLPIFPGLAKYDEAASVNGIEHALRFTAVSTQRKYVWPATHFASASTDPTRPPMGMRFRLKASVNIDSLPPIPRAIAQAMKTYGIILADNGSNWFVSGVPDSRWDNGQLAQLNNLIRGSDFEAVDVSTLIVSPTSGQVAPRPSTTTLASSANPSPSGQNVTFTATVTGAHGPPTGTVAFTNGGAAISGCGAVALASGTATCQTNALQPGSRSIVATYSGNVIYAGSAAVALSQVVTTGATLLTANPTTLAFGGQSMNTTSPSQSTTIANNSGAAVTITSVTAPQGFVATHSCGTLNNGASCVIGLTFTPNAQGSMNNLLAVAYAGGGPTTVALTGTGERSLVTHYYRSILRRAPDAGGKTFWEGEGARVSTLGANVNETWYSMAQQFYFSPEYFAFNRNNGAFVTDLYNTFFNRAPDSGGLAFWTNNLNSGMPREVALAEFMFSPEFRNFSQAIFGNRTARAELDMVMDFYRGLLARLPDDGGFNFWVGRFRTAQCQGQAALVNEVEAISSAFTLSGEYAARGRTTAQYVGDLYNAFLRRGGDLTGVQFWINEINSGARTREQVRMDFKNSAEFQVRVQAMLQQGCL